ncbi:cytochrome P450 [Aspergillus venezuelensis]
MSLVTGIRTPTPAADHMKALYKVLDGSSEILEMGATPPVDIFPFLAITLLAFVQAVAIYPDIKKAAQQEIDGTIGAERSPSWSDYSSLPYISMVIKETMRWRPVMPTAFPHATSKECTIDGMTIPAGSTVMINVWGLHHNDSIHNNPDEFNPSRYEGRTELANVYASSPDYKNRDHYGYGAGRRICPGIHLAERGLFIAIVKMLWAFETTPTVYSTGSTMPIDCDPATGYSDGFLRCPLPFAVDFKLRSEERGRSIRAELRKAEEDVLSHYET